MTVSALCFSAEKAGALSLVQAVEIVAGAGIVGDHHFSRRPREAGRDLTLIEAEEVEAFNARTGSALAPTDPRRNVVTRGVRLNDLVGRTFTIGTVTLRGIELCEPCGVLAKYLAGPSLTKKEFVREFAHRCGLRADVLVSGTIRVGDAIVIPD